MSHTVRLFRTGSWFHNAQFQIFHQCRVFGLSSSTTYHYHVISFDPAGNQNTSSDETFTTNTQPSNREHFSYVIDNRPPSNPAIDGPTIGRILREYDYIVKSVDADNDSIEYIFLWGDGTRESSGFLPSGINCSTKHSWTKAGKYIITVTARDNRTNSSSTQTIWIDTLALEDIGYLIDNDSDGLYEAFYTHATGIVSLIEMQNGKYLIDIDGDKIWEYSYDPMNGTISLIPQPTIIRNERPVFPLLIGGLIAIVASIIMIFFFRRRPPKNIIREKH